MIHNKLKAQAIIDLHTLKTEQAGSKLLTILDLLILDLRLANDTVDKERLKINQGEIKGYLQLRDYLNNGLPNITKNIS